MCPRASNQCPIQLCPAMPMPDATRSQKLETVCRSPHCFVNLHFHVCVNKCPIVLTSKTVSGSACFTLLGKSSTTAPKHLLLTVRSCKSGTRKEYLQNVTASRSDFSLLVGCPAFFSVFKKTVEVWFRHRPKVPKPI